MRTPGATIVILMLGLAAAPVTGNERGDAVDDTITVYSVAEGGFVETAMVEKTDAEWKKELDAEVYDVTRRQGTERAFTGSLWDNKREGLYRCVACGNDLFVSATKFDSGTGWPSFFEPVNEANVGTEKDRSWFVVRTEVHCARCGAHLGHVFDDGPRPTGLRYCLNSASLDFVEMEVR